MGGGVFVSYRREDTQGSAGRLYDRLTNELGRETVFFDVDNIVPGADFVEVLSNRVGSCDALLAVIGGHWTSVKDDTGQRRLDNPNDFVRIEVEAALDREVPVIPVLVDGARMPRADELPDSLKRLTRRQAAEVSHARFDFDTDRLFRVVRRIIDERVHAEQERQRVAEAERIAADERRRVAEETAARAAADKRRREAEKRAARAEERKRRKAEAAAAAEREMLEPIELHRDAEPAKLQAEAEAARVSDDVLGAVDGIEAVRGESDRPNAEADVNDVLEEERWRQIGEENAKVLEISRRKAELEDFIARLRGVESSETDIILPVHDEDCGQIELRIAEIINERLHFLPGMIDGSPEAEPREIDEMRTVSTDESGGREINKVMKKAIDDEKVLINPENKNNIATAQDSVLLSVARSSRHREASEFHSRSEADEGKIGRQDAFRAASEDRWLSDEGNRIRTRNILSYRLTRRIGEIFSGRRPIELLVFYVLLFGIAFSVKFYGVMTIILNFILKAD